MTTKHTQGPWSHRNGRIFQTDWEVLTIANVARAHDGDYSPANARLIAAAPELLEALIELVNGPECGGDHGAMYRNARATIAKATGEAE